MLGGDRHDRQPVALARQDEAVEFREFFEFGERNCALEFPDVAHVDQIPAGILFAGFGIVVLRLGVELRRIRIGFARDFGDADDARRLAVRMLEKHLVADPHVVAHHVARLVVANAVPGFALVALEIVDAVSIGL